MVSIGYGEAVWAANLMYNVHPLLRSVTVYQRIDVIKISHCCFVIKFLADRTNGRAIGTVLRPASVVCRRLSSVT